MNITEHRYCCGILEFGKHEFCASDVEAKELVTGCAAAAGWDLTTEERPRNRAGRLLMVTLNSDQAHYLAAYKSFGFRELQTWVNINSSNRCYLLGKVV